MPNRPSYNPLKDSVFLKEIYEAAEIIDRWTPSQRRTYLAGLRKREKLQGKNIYRTIIRLMLTNPKGRKNFIRLFREGKL